MADSNHITKVAIVGAGGNVGTFITNSLLATGKHTVTALTRSDSTTKAPEGVTVKTIDYNKPETIVEALKGQDALVITLSGHSPKETEEKLVVAAGEAGVGWIVPNDWSPDSMNEELVRDVFIFKSKVATRKAITDLGKSSFISIATGFWYEYSLAIAPTFGIDLVNHKATLFDDGETKVSVSTWPQVGRAVAALLSLPIKAEGLGKEGCLDNFKNQVVYINSFTISQKDMLESAYRVTDTKKEEWTFESESSHQRYSDGLKEIKEGKRVGFAKMLYGRVFYPDSSGDFERSRGTLNSLLGLPHENIDDATEIAVERSKTPAWTG